MNSCILMAQVISNPELRSTQDNTSVSSMMVEFPSGREGEDPGKVQVEGWGNLAEDMKNSYHVGDRVIIEGRLSMNLFEMPEGYKEKRAKLVASRIYPMDSSDNHNNSASVTNNQTYRAPSEPSSNVVDFASTYQAQAAPVSANTTTTTPEPTAPASDNNEDWDQIPF
ncbi:single-stranded DNA-binding protein [Waterburya agarophytonicola K14]|uniref:Single-stranded DNA-binding protein n=1 Tax=Waterburya agarophytonicola KI4 TaxID=2874699 RepID=A0A964BN72_9CYAN|nr:single-stranded DNA-binding protein [Waterburya agarophytonicola]MCC0176355.1 single-stranded DNA-binding protein [Waterburya agarophytonicola KI4]